MNNAIWLKISFLQQNGGIHVKNQLKKSLSMDRIEFNNKHGIPAGEKRMSGFSLEDR